MTEWIKCSDCMPEHLQDVLVAVIESHNKWDKTVFDAFWHAESKQWYRSYCDIVPFRNEEIEEWMPLPLPPKYES